MNVLISGSGGLLGSALLPTLASRGHRAVRLVRGRPARGESEVAWDPSRGTIDTAALEGIDAVVHLAGATIASWPWTAAHKRGVLESRTRPTALLAASVASLARKPRVFISASAVGYYGSRGDEVLRETSHPGSGFLAEVCRAWEAAAGPVARAGVRLVTLRIGIVLTDRGGALPALTIPFRLGLGGRIGNGRQYMSWIALDDLIGVIVRTIEEDKLSGPLNAVAPQAITNSEFTRALGRVLQRPTLLPVPAFAVRLLLGRSMADELLLASSRVEPARLLDSDYAFRFPALEDALRYALIRREDQP